MLSRIFLAMQKAYTGKYALVMNTVTAGTLGGVGDLLAQKSEMKFAKKEWDFSRTRNMAFVCMCGGPLMHFWYRFLDGRYPGKSIKAVRTKLLIDLLSGPFWYCWYLGGLSVLRGDTPRESVKEFKDKVPIIIAFDLTLWPLFQGINFRFFPAHYRVLVMKTNELFFDVVFSHIVHNEYTLTSIFKSLGEVVTGKDKVS